MSNCEVCASTGDYCITCEEYYVVSENKLCEKDTTCRISNCKTCDSSLTTCKECSSGYLLDSLGQCQ